MGAGASGADGLGSLGPLEFREDLFLTSGIPLVHYWFLFQLGKELFIIHFLLVHGSTRVFYQILLLLDLDGRIDRFGQVCIELLACSIAQTNIGLVGLFLRYVEFFGGCQQYVGASQLVFRI